MMIRFFATLLAMAVFAAPASAAILYDYNFSAFGETNITNVVQAQTTASSILGFHNNDGSVDGLGRGTITVGDTFEDFTAIKFTTYTDNGSGTFTSPVDVTVLTRFNGVQIAPNAYSITGISQFDVYADFGPGKTSANFFDLTTFMDGVLVQTGVLGGPSSGTNASPTLPNGAINVLVKLTDTLHSTAGFLGQYFNLDSVTGLPLDTAGSLTLQGLFDGNNTTTPPLTPLGGLNNGQTMTLAPGATLHGFGEIFGLTGTQLNNGTITSLTGFDFAFQTRSTVGFQVGVVPEPSSLAVIGLLGGLVAFRRRRA